jgi:Fe-S-cluster containining protein
MEMDPEPQVEPEADSVTARVGLSIAGERWRAEITLPAAPTRVGDVLPVFQSLADVMVRGAVHAVEAEGKTVSCRKGCGACCRQLVPIAPAEARRIRDLVADLPEPRRTEVRRRFADARRRLEAAGLLEPLLHPDQDHTISQDARRGLGRAYFAQQIACSFLDDESCSIHPDRPIACREYLVTSPAANCARPTPETVTCVPMPAVAWRAVARFEPVSPATATVAWVPLILAPEWADAHPDEPAPRPAPELLREFLERLTGETIEPWRPGMDPRGATPPRMG